MATKSVKSLISSWRIIWSKPSRLLVSGTAAALTASQWLPNHGAWRRIPPFGFTKDYSISGRTISRLYSTGKSQDKASKPPLPLQGITVVSLEQAIAAPFCTRQLADLGARVIKVERPGTGDFARHYDTRVNGLCSHFVWCNRSKESLALDLKDAKDIKTLHKLLGRADVFVQNLAPGATDRLGISYDALKDAHPALVVCDISGYGSYGPYRDKKAYDLLIQSEAGLLSVTGTKDQPAKAGISIADISAGMYAFSNVLAALYNRKNTGKGCRVDVSMLECMVEWMSFPLYYASDGAPAPVPVGASHAAIYPYGPFQTGDGNSVMIGLQNEREWAKFCSDILEDTSLIEDPRFASNAERSVNRDALTDIIHKALASFTVEQAADKLDKAGIANASVNDMHRVWAHPQLKSRQRWTTVDSPNGHLPAMLPPGIDPEQANVRMDPIPTVGEHNEKILAELGME